MKTKTPDGRAESTMQSLLSLALNLSTHQARRLKDGIWLLLLLGSVNAGRATDVTGTIVGEHWTKANSPYCAVGDILAADLTIDPGVRIYFVSNYVFEIAADVTAIGTPADPIVFTSTNGTVGWQGIFFNASGDDSTVAWCWIQNSVKSGIRVFDSSPVIRNCVITNNTIIGNGGGIWVQNSTYDLLLQNCTIINNRSKGDNTGRMGMGGGIAAFMGQGVLRLSGTTVSGNATVPDPGTP
ncbi:MAG: right-handed parallel beta-helix repeat-containing protein [Verrucomicrobia bacterium]|nr:right-handed parallel beta-helix repeat-containing protein [Verrucomicrobiota bacterium]